MLKLAQVLSLVCLLSLPAVGLAQTRARTATRRHTASNARSARNTSATALSEAQQRVADVVKVLTRFLYLYGRTSSGVENSEQQARETGGALSPQAASILDRSRATIQQSVSDIRDRLDQLALYFRTTPSLDRYATHVTDLSASAANAEQQAQAGQLDAAGRTLIDVANQLTDLLLDLK